MLLRLATLVFMAVACANFIASPAMAQASQLSAAEDIRANLLYVKYGFGEGLSGLSIHRNGMEQEVGFFGAHIDELFGDVPSAMASAETYRTQRIAGTIAYGAGMTALVTNLILIVSSTGVGSDAFINANPEAMWGLSIGGFVVGMVGAMMLGTSGSHLVNAVNQYNGDLLNQHLPEHNKIDLEIFVSMLGGAKSAGLKIAF